MPKISVEVPDELLADLDEHVGEDGKFVNRSEAIRASIRKTLAYGIGLALLWPTTPFGRPGVGVPNRPRDASRRRQRWSRPILQRFGEHGKRRFRIQPSPVES